LVRQSRIFNNEQIALLGPAKPDHPQAILILHHLEWSDKMKGFSVQSFLWLAAAGSVLVFGAARADSFPGASVSGTIVEGTSGRPVPDAEIRIDGLSKCALSRDGGGFLIRGVPPGIRSIRIRAMGYRDMEMPNVTFSGDTTLRLVLKSDPLRMDPVLITGTRTDHLLSAVTVCAKVLPSDWIGNRNGSTAAEAVESAGGVTVKDGGGFAGIKTLSIRGSGDAQVLVLLDGQRLNAAQDGSVDLGAIPSESLEKIEIVRGGHSSLVGSDAIGGAVHLFTRNAPTGGGLTYGFRSTVGSFGTRGGGTYGSARFGRFDAFAAYNRTLSDGDFDFRSPLDGLEHARENNDYSGSHLLAKVGAGDPHGGGRIQLLFNRNRSNRGSADAVHSTFSSGRARRDEKQDLYGALLEKRLNAVLRVRGQIFHQDRRYGFRSLYENDRHDAGATGIEASATWAVNAACLLSAGMDARRDGLNSTKFSSRRRETAGGFIQTEIDHGWRVIGLDTRWKWIPALRWEKNWPTPGGSGTGTAWGNGYPKIGVLIRPFRNADFSLRSNIGRSFRLPTFNDLYWPELIWPGAGGVAGNDRLVPETALTADAGFSWSFGESVRLTLAGTVFENRIRHLIQWESDAEWVYTPRNVGRARIRGIEAEWGLSLPSERLHLTLSPVWMDARDRTVPGHSPKLVYRPDFSMDAEFGTRLASWRLNGTYMAMGRRHTQADHSRSLGPFERTGLNAQWGRNWRGGRFWVKGEVNNLANRRITLVEGYPLPGREFRLTIGQDG
jgi:vitamin B12 transporter